MDPNWGFICNLFSVLLYFSTCVLCASQSNGTKNCLVNPSGTDCCPPIESTPPLTEAELVARLTHPCRYDKLVRPDSITGGSLPITVQIHLHHLESVANFQFVAYMTIKYKYKDYRLKYAGKQPRPEIIGEEDLKNRVWIPHLFIQNERESKIMGVESKDVFMRITDEGEVVYSYRMTASFYCWMDLKKFPFDSQECYLKWTSWSYNMTSLTLSWDNPGFTVAEDMHLTEFVLDSYSYYTSVINGNFTGGLSEGDSSQLTVHFKLYREVGYYLLDYFIPSILLVCTSWVSFWLQADAGPPRAVLGASPIVAFITLNVGLGNSLPKVSSVKASDIWFFAISCFLFLALSEFAFVNVIWRRKKKIELKKNNSMHILKGAIVPKAAREHLRRVESNHSFSTISWDRHSCGSLPHFNPDDVVTIKIGIPDDDSSISSDNPSPNHGHHQQQPMVVPATTWATMTPQEVAIWIDRKSRVVFPISFIIFNVFYWVFVWIP